MPNVRSVSLFNSTGKWKYDAEIVIPDDVPIWDVRNYLRDNEVPLAGLVTNSAKWIREGGFIFVDNATEAPHLVFSRKDSILDERGSHLHNG